jgi:hypothetical protein
MSQCLLTRLVAQRCVVRKSPRMLFLFKSDPQAWPDSSKQFASICWGGDASCRFEMHVQPHNVLPLQVPKQVVEFTSRLLQYVFCVLRGRRTCRVVICLRAYLCLVCCASLVVKLFNLTYRLSARWTLLTESAVSRVLVCRSESKFWFRRLLGNSGECLSYLDPSTWHASHYLTCGAVVVALFSSACQGIVWCKCVAMLAARPFQILIQAGRMCTGVADGATDRAVMSVTWTTFEVPGHES